MKIYTDDELVSYRHTTIDPEKTRDEISAILREYDVGLIAWNWKPQFNDVWVQFQIEEIIDGIQMKISAKVICPIIWDKGSSRRTEQPNWRVSMRALYWYIKTHLETSYAMQSSKVAAFLPDMVTPSGKRYFDVMKARLDQFQALEEHKEKPMEVQVIKPKNITPKPDETNEVVTEEIPYNEGQE
jgi:hypothetical protein